MTVQESTTSAGSGTRLAQSLDRLGALSAETAKDLQSMLESFDPAKDAVQVGRQINELAAHLDWSKMPTNFKDTKGYSEAWSELSEIQSAAIKELGETQRRMFQSTFSGGQNCWSALTNVTDPEGMTAAVIEANIEQFEDMKSNALRLAQESARIKSAYMAWTEKTLRSLMTTS